LGRHHPSDRPVFNGDAINRVDARARVPRCEVTTPPRKALRHASDSRAPSCSCRCSLPFASFQRRRCALVSACSSSRKKRGLAISSPVESPAKGFGPTSLPTSCPVAGTGNGSTHAQENETVQVPVLLRCMVAVLGVPSKGRCKT